jgi:3-hydroxyisobutyrate dehydrogenase-like beta-hydroxyacid dehydrogenase
MTSQQPRVGFVGLGSQGGPMAQRIVESGFPLTLWARRPESLVPHEDTTAAVAATRRELGEASDVLCVCVVGDADVDEVLRGGEGALAGMAAGGVVVVHSTVHPDTCRRLQDDFPDLHVLDAPVSGGGHRAAAGELLVMVGGDERAFERCRPVFSTYADPLVHLGPLGAGQRAKLLNNALFTAQLGLAADVLALGRDQGLDVAGLAAVLLAGSGRSYALEVVSGAGHDLAAMAELAGPLLAKDVALLAGLLPPAADPVVVTAADAALARMGIDRNAEPQDVA